MAVAFEVSTPPSVQLGTRFHPPVINFPYDLIELGTRVSPPGISVEGGDSGGSEQAVAEPVQYWSS